MFRCIQRGRESGKRVHEQLVLFTWRWNGKAYHSDPSRSFRFSYATLNRLYYAWRKGGDSALALHYHGGRQKIGPAQLRPLLEVCLRPETLSFGEAYRQLGSPVVAECSYRYALNVMDRGLTRRLLAQRRKVVSAELVGRRILQEMAG